jgi:1,4-dihydroxy-2-naphthoyl-CoA synthase
MSENVKIIIKKTETKKDIDDFSEILFRKPIANCAEIFMHQPEEEFTETFDKNKAFKIVSWISDTRYTRKINVLYLTEKGIIREEVILEKIPAENTSKRARKYGFSFNYKETKYYRLVLL